MRTRARFAIGITVAAIAVLSGCTGVGGPDPTGPASPSAPAPTPSDTPVEPAFAIPADCTQVLPQERIDSFAAQGMILLGGPGGLYEDYFVDPTPEEEAGGITCIWGDEQVPESTVTVSVAPISDDTRQAIVDDLLSQGLNQAALDDGTGYVRAGDEVSSPAIINLVRANSWISVIEALGGEAFLEEALAIADEVTAQVHAD